MKYMKNSKVNKLPACQSENKYAPYVNIKSCVNLVKILTNIYKKQNFQNFASSENTKETAPAEDTILNKKKPTSLLLATITQ